MMIKICRCNKESIVEKLKSGKIEFASFGSTNLVDEIILSMHTNNILDCLSKGIPDRRADNTTIPFNLVWACAIAAKMKSRSSLSDIPFAISDHRTLAALGYTLIETNGKLARGLMRESSLRFLLGKYSSLDLISAYNNTVQNYIFPMLDILPDIHILDCTKIEVNFNNTRYEKSGIAINRKGERMRGYKLATLRGLTGDTGVIEDIRFDSANINDLALSEEMLRTSPCLKSGDILLADRGFISRDLINYLKSACKVDIYIP